MTLRRKMVPLEDYFANIEARLGRAPTTQQMRHWTGDKVPQLELRRYARMVNAFGWSAGPMTRYTVRTVAEGEPEPADADAPMDAEPYQGAEMPAAAAEQDDEDEPAAAAAAESENDEPSPLPPAEVMVDATMAHGLFVTTHPRSKTGLLCACKRNGGWTKAFPTAPELYVWVMQQYGAAWRRELKLKQY